MMKPRQLTPEEETYLRENYATTLNRDIVKRLHTSHRTLARWARQYGLVKDWEAIEPLRRELISKLSRKALLLRSYKGHPENGIATRFKPGYNAREKFGAEKFEAMHRKTVESRQRTIREERARVAFGLPQKTRLRVVRQPRQKIEDRCYLKKRGYILDEKNNIAYYTEETTRAVKLEAMPKRFYTFKEYQDGNE